MNKIFLRGHVGKDSKITQFQDGKVAQFTLAVSERGYTTKSGKEVPEQTEWFNIVVRRPGMAEVCEKYVKKGTPLLIIGKVRTREYKDESDQTRRIMEIVVDEMELLGGKKDEEPAQRPQRKDGYVPIDDLPF